jgi:integrase
MSDRRRARADLWATLRGDWLYYAGAFVAYCAQRPLVNTTYGTVDAGGVTQSVAAILQSEAVAHWPRHTCAMRLIARRAQPREVMEVLRHKSIRTTMDAYGHLFPENVREIINDLDQDLDPWGLEVRHEPR